jgi:hypothetical protein
MYEQMHYESQEYRQTREQMRQEWEEDRRMCELMQREWQEQRLMCEQVHYAWQECRRTHEQTQLEWQEHQREINRWCHEQSDRFAEWAGARPERAIPKGATLRLHARTICTALASRGWYLPLGSVTLCQIASWGAAIGNATGEEIDRAIEKFTRESLPIIRRDSKTAWPHRADILDQAFEAHEAKLYAASIPTFLAQADGITTELLGVHLFAKERGSAAPKAARAIETHLVQYSGLGVAAAPNDMHAIMLEPIRHATGLNQHTKDRDRQRLARQPVSPLNRHGVLHGYDTDYPNEGNSLRAILTVAMLNGVRSALQSRRDLLALCTAAETRARRN